jgi:arabinofuranosyltransferase
MKRPNTAIALLMMVMSIAVILQSAWISDDAYITLRTSDNWLNGYGLTWNAGERVQTYTHPLWMVLLSGVFLVVRNGYAAAMLLSLIVSFTVIAVFLYEQSDDWAILLLGGGVLLLSKAFVDYSTSGLENPLTHFFLLVFSIVLFRSEFPVSRRTLFTLALVAGCAAFNRFDTILFFLPAILYILSSHFKSARGIGLTVLGFLPFILWEIFAVFYYGFPFPNTAYAKLNSGITTHLIFA